MQVTRIGNENISYFEEMLGDELSPSQIALGVINNGEAAGVIVCTIRDTVCIIDNLFIAAKHRREGAASLLVKSVTEAMPEIGVSDFLLYYKEDKILTAFLEKSGFVCTFSDTLHSINMADIKANEHFEKLIAGDSRSVCSLEKLNRVQLECISRFIAKAQFDPSLIEKENYDPAMSFAACTNNEVQGFILAKEIGSEIFVTLLLAHDNNIPAITQIFGSFLKNAESRNIKKITFIVSNDTILNSLSRIFKDELKTTDNVCSALLSI